MSLAPASIASQLFDKIIILDPSEKSFVFQVASLKRELDKLKVQRPAESYCLRGMLACIEKKFDEMQRFHEAAIDTADGAYQLHYSYLNYAVSLRRAHQYFSAYDQALLAYGLAPTSVDTIIELHKACVYIGRFHDAAHYIRDIDPKGQDEVTEKDMCTFKHFYDEYSGLKINDQDIEDVMRSAYELLNAANLGQWDQVLSFSSTSEGIPTGVSYRIIAANCSETAALEQQLCEMARQLNKTKAVEGFLRFSFSGNASTSPQEHPWDDILSVDQDDNFLAQYQITSLLNNCFHSDQFDVVEDSLRSFEIDRASPGLLVSILSSTLAAQASLPARPQFFARVYESLSKRGQLKPNLLEGLE